jgi:hypothetical protein
MNAEPSAFCLGLGNALTILGQSLGKTVGKPTRSPAHTVGRASS